MLRHWLFLLLTGTAGAFFSRQRRWGTAQSTGPYRTRYLPQQVGARRGPGQRLLLALLYRRVRAAPGAKLFSALVGLCRE